MTESEWITCTDPMPMLKFLEAKATSRKLRLFACACCRRFHTLLSAEERKAVDVAEASAEGEATADKMANAFRAAWLSTENVWRDAAGAAAQHAAYHDAFDAAEAASWNAGQAGKGSIGYAKERAAQADLLKDIFGNHFLSVSFAPSVLLWGDGTVPRVAQAIYDERAFDRLPILADALEEVGCDNADILEHLRWLGPHCRGCWVVDLLLGRS